LLWYARFWDAKAGRYAAKRSTGVMAEGKRERRREAEAKAREMLAGIRFDTEVADTPFVEYVENFWKPGSPYVKECAMTRNPPLSATHLKDNAASVRLYIKPFPKFNGARLRDVTAGLVRDWMAWAMDNGMSARTINKAICTMRTAARYAVSREDIEKDPFRAIKKAVESPKEKEIVTFAERAALLKSKPRDLLARLAVLLGLLCGMRRGEVRGLKWGDLDNGLIRLTHNFVEVDGLKKPKSGKARIVPYPAVLATAFDGVRGVTANPLPEAYVFDSACRPGQPMGETFFRNAVEKELAGIGISPDEQRKRNLTFHSLRHSFITLGRSDGISDLEIQAMAGHSDRKMMEHYTHAEKAINFYTVREKLEKAVGLAKPNVLQDSEIPGHEQP